jgi:membrane protein YdbS with pleckstrin-like domain
MTVKLPAAQVDQYLLRTEKMIFSVRRHWVALAEVGGMLALYWLGALLVLVFLGDVELLRLVAVCFMFFSLCWFFWQILDWRIERFMVTNRRVLLISGILTRNVAIMPLMKVTDLTYQQSPLGRILNYGSFILESAGQQQALSRVDFLPQPAKRYQQVSGLLFGTDVDVDPDDLGMAGPPGGGGSGGNGGGGRRGDGGGGGGGRRGGGGDSGGASNGVASGANYDTAPVPTIRPVR